MHKCFDVGTGVEGWNEVAEDIHISGEVLQYLLQVFLLVIGAFEVDVLVLLVDDEEVHHKSVADPVEDALTDCLLQSVEVVGEKLDLNGNPVFVNGEVRPVFLAKQVDTADDGVLVDLAVNFAVDPVPVGGDRRHKCQLKLPLGLAGQVEAGVLDDRVQGFDVVPDLTAAVT